MITFRVLTERRSLGPRHVRKQKDVRTTLNLLLFVVSFDNGDIMLFLMRFVKSKKLLSE